MNVSETAPDAIVVVREPFMIEAKQMEDGGVEIVYGYRVLGDAPADLIARAIGRAGGETGAGHPAREGVGVMIAAFFS